MSANDTPSGDAARLAQAQLDAYNALDVDAFVACYHPDVEVFDLHSGQKRFEGQGVMRERYGAQFERCPDLHAEVVNRIVVGATAVDHEKVVGLVPDEVVEVIAMYQIEDGLIRRVWFAK